MFVISLTYTAPVEDVDVHIDAHRDWLVQGLSDGWLLLAGRKEPRTGGIIIARGVREAVEQKAATDPFVLNGVASVTVTEFLPTMTVPGLESLKP